MLYWLTATAGSAAFIGYAQAGGWGQANENSGVPTAALVLAHDVGIRRCAERENTITRWTDIDRGGHFAALEEPDLLVGDVREFFRALRRPSAKVDSIAHRLTPHGHPTGGARDVAFSASATIAVVTASGTHRPAWTSTRAAA